MERGAAAASGLRPSSSSGVVEEAEWGGRGGGELERRGGME